MAEQVLCVHQEEYVTHTHSESMSEEYVTHTHTESMSEGGKMPILMTLDLIFLH